jgi:hypothetical protein
MPEGMRYAILVENFTDLDHSLLAAGVHEFLKSIGYDVQPNDFVIHFIGVEDDAGPLVDLTGQYGREVPRRRPATTDTFGSTSPNPS